MYKIGIHWLSAIYPLLGKVWAFRGYFPALHSSAVLELQTSLYMTCSLDHSLMSAIFLSQCHAGTETCHTQKQNVKKKVETERTLETQPVTKSVISKQCRKLESNDTTGNKRLMTCKQYIL